MQRGKSPSIPLFQRGDSFFPLSKGENRQSRLVIKDFEFRRLLIKIVYQKRRPGKIRQEPGVWSQEYEEWDMERMMWNMGHLEQRRKKTGGKADRIYIIIKAFKK
jgi:hypothetical protein